jgi:hypothetical protein
MHKHEAFEKQSFLMRQIEDLTVFVSFDFLRLQIVDLQTTKRTSPKLKVYGINLKRTLKASDIP